jgi:hypothetical protein
VKALWEAEAIGWGSRKDRLRPGARGWVDRDGLTPWVARITGFSARYGYRREFLPHKTSYLNASSSGQRGVRFYWTLEEGEYYQAHYPLSWSRTERVFLKVDETGAVVQVPREEVDAWLRERLNVASVSTS